MGYWDKVNKVIDEADILLEVLDARLIEETRNREIENKIENTGKKLIYIINKADLIDDRFLRGKLKELKHYVIMSVKKKTGLNDLRKKIMTVAHGDQVKVGVLGYPNVGKSSVINTLSKGKAKTSSQSGYTKGIQILKAGSKISFLDTPGVIPHKEEDEIKHAIIGAKSYDRLREPDIVAMRLIEIFEGLFEKHYGIEIQDDPLDSLEKIAEKLNLLKKGGVPDLNRAGRKVVQDWQTGKIKI